ncbi:hypothetical protein JW911_01110 [Candidatus Peregrinibacteria bacterium]|nr:hypothetical protein [Candidatus Peregrinibacteria bacterium]
MEKLKFLKSKDIQGKIYLVLSIILLLTVGYYSYTNFTKFFDMREEIAVNEKLHSALVSVDQTVADELKKVKEEGSALEQKIKNELDQVLPKTENHTALTRALEMFSNNLNRLKDPFVVSNLQYMKLETPKSGNYQVLPIKMTIHSTYSNFYKFLDFIDNSGALSDGSRLLDVQSIIINFVSPKGSQNNLSGQDEINFNISINAYIRKS